MHQSLVPWQCLQFLVSSQGFLMKFLISRNFWWNFTPLVLHPWEQLATNVRAAKKWWREKDMIVKGGMFLSGKMGLMKESWSDFWDECLIATLWSPLENSQVMYLCQPKMELQIDKKKTNHTYIYKKYIYILFFFFFGAILKPVLKFLYQKGKHGCVFFTVHWSWAACGMGVGHSHLKVIINLLSKFEQQKLEQVMIGFLLHIHFTIHFVWDLMTM